MSAVLAVCGCDGNDGRESSGPRIEPALLGSLTIDADGGTDTVSYSIINPVEGGKVSASASESWISGLDCSTENAVIITSDPNPETVRRSCVITLTYPYSEGGKAETQINVIQKEAVPYDFDMSLEIFTATWYGPLFGLDGEHRYYTWVSDMPFVNSTTQVGGTYYLFDIFSTAPADESDPLPPAGTYTLGEEGATAAMTFTPEYSMGVSTTTDEQVIFDTGIGVLPMGTRADHITESGTYVGLIADGEMTVSGEAGAYSVECSFLTAEGRSVTCSWSGDVTVTGDNWIVQLLPGPGPDGVQIELVTSGDGVEDGIPDGTYTASTSAVPSAGEFMTGSMTDGIVFGTNYVGDFTEQGLADGFAPATAGRLDVTGHGDGTCTFEFSFLDDKGNTWDGKWTGTLSVRSSSGIKQMKLF